MSILVAKAYAFFKRACGPAIAAAFLLLSVFTSRAQGVPGPDTKMQEYNAQAVSLINNRRFEDAIPLVEKAIQEKDNATSHYYLCHIHATNNDWKEGISEGEKATKLDPNFLPVYPELFFCYTKLGRWKDAEKISEQVKKSSQNGGTDQLLNELNTSLENDGRSKILLALFFLVLAGGFLYPIYSAGKKEPKDFSGPGKFRFSEIILLSASVSSVFWLIFYSCSHWIWASNSTASYSELTPYIGMYNAERDGLESFALYVLMFGNATVTLLLTLFLARIRSVKSVYIGCFSVLFLLTAYYFYKVGFIPPMMEMGEADASKFPLILGFLAVISIGGYLLYQKYSMVVKCLLVLFMAYAALVMILPSSLLDMQYVLFPALRMTYGAKIPEIYFQYDLYLSFLALIILKMKMSLELFPYIGQIGFFLFFVVAFFFSDRFFKTKGLSVLFIIAIIVIRYYAIWEVGAGIFQVTPLRLDLWIIPLIIAYRKGIHHWLVGVAFGLLVLFHRNLGLIYLTSYAELLIILFLADVVKAISEREMSGGKLSALFTKHFKANIINIAIIISSVALCFVLFKELFSPAALIYRKLGVGMIRIASISFYWYVPVILSSVVVLAFRLRHKLGERYSVAVIFLSVLTIGQSIYFFGRSHENAILNASAIYLLLLFSLFDILISQSPSTVPVTEDIAATKSKAGKKEAAKEPVYDKYLTKRNFYLSLPFLVIFFSGYYYSGRIAEKVDTQYNNFKEGQYVCPILPMMMDTTAVRTITHESPNVYFLDFNTDFYYYYYGHYKPMGYFNPTAAWVYRKDLIGFMQDLLDKGYYVVYNMKRTLSYQDYVPRLQYNHVEQRNELIALSKDKTDLLLPPAKDAASLHVAYKDTVAAPGYDYAGINLKDQFSIEIVLKPSASQRVNASVLNNFSRIERLKGLMIQTTGIPDQYVFGYSTEKSFPNTVFQLAHDKWHYLVITVNKDMVKIYDNGVSISGNNVGGMSFVNSDIPFVVGNAASRDAHFSGYIREVKITNANIPEAEITTNTLKIASLN